MVPKFIFAVCLYISSVSAQGPTAFDKGPSSSDIMGNIFAWASAVRPVDPVNSQSASVSDTGLPPEPALPDMNAGFSAGSDFGFPAEPSLSVKDKLPSEAAIPDPLRSQSASVSDTGLPLEPTLPDRNAGFPSGSDLGFPSEPKLPVKDPVRGKESILSGQVLPPPPVNKHPRHTDVNLDADIVDPNLLFPAESANAPNPNVGNNKLMLNFMPFFPKGKKVVNLNNGQTLNSPSDIGALPDPNIVDSSFSGFPPEKSPPKIDFSPFFPKGEKVVNLNNGQTLSSFSDISVLPDPNIVDSSVSGFPSEKLPLKPDLSVVSPFVPNGNQPLVEPPFNNRVQIKSLPDKPLLPAGAMVNSMSGNQFIPTGPQLQPVETPPQKPHLPLGPAAEELPFVPPRRRIDRPGRPISMLPVGTIEAAKKPENLPLDRPNLAGVQPDIFGLPDSLVPSDTQLLTDITNQGQDGPPTSGQDFLPTAGRGFGLARDTNKMPSNWLNLYPDGRPKKLQNVKTGDVRDIAPPTADQAMLSAISLTSFGKDRAMRRMLRQQRRQARKNKRRQQQQGGRGVIPNQRNVPNRRNAQNQRTMQNRRNQPNQRNMSNQRNRARGRNQNRNINRGPVIGRRRGRKLRRSKRKAPLKGGKFPRGKGRKGMKKQKGFGKQKGRERQFQREMQSIFPAQDPHVSNPDSQMQSDGVMQGGVVSDVTQLDGLPLLGGQLAELPVAEQIQQEAAKHIIDPGLPKLKPNKWEKKQRAQWSKMGPTQKKAEKFAKMHKEGIMVSDGSVADLAVTEQIKQEAAKHVGDLAFPGKLQKRQKKQKRFRNVPKDKIQMSNGIGGDLAVTEQIKHEAAKHVGNLAFPGKQRKRHKKSKMFRNVPKDAIQISDSSVADLAVTEQIKQEAAKHVGDLAFPGRKVRKGKQLQRRKLKKQKKKNKFPMDNVELPGGIEGLPVTEQIKREAAKHVENQAFPKKLKGKEKRLQRRRDQFNHIQNSGNQFVRQNKKRANKAGKRRPFIKRMRSGRRPKTRLTKQFVDVSLEGNGAVSDAATIDHTVNAQAGMRKRAKKARKGKTFIQRMRSRKTPKTKLTRKFVDVSLPGTVPENDGSGVDQTSVDKSQSGQIMTIPGLGTIDFS